MRLSRKELANMTKYSVVAIKKIESGERNLSYHKAKVMALALQLDDAAYAKLMRVLLSKSSHEDLPAFNLPFSQG